MANKAELFEDFLVFAGEEHRGYIMQLHNFFTEEGCDANVKEAKRGYIVSYVHKPTKRTVANYIFRKNGIMMRIYPENIMSYPQIIDTLPTSMKASMEKASVCKKLLDPTTCSPNCKMGFDYILEGKQQQKCRSNAFLFFLNDDDNPYIEEIVKNEVVARNKH